MSTVTITRELAENLQVVLDGQPEIPAEQLEPGELNISDLAGELSRAIEAPVDWQAMVREFHVKFGCKHADKPVSEMDLGTVALRHRLHQEEIEELRRAMYNVDLVEIADALADSIYVLLGTAVTYGIDLAPIFAEVHRTNMAKDGGATRADGKILKPEGWQPPDIAGLIEQQRGGAL